MPSTADGPLMGDVPVASGPSILLIATVAATVRGFLRPYGSYLRQRGWRVEAAANGLAGDPGVGTAFDAVHDLPLSRSLRDVGGLVRGEREIDRLIRETKPDIVHLHTPIAAYTGRWAARRSSPESRPSVVYTAHGFHAYPGGPRLVNAAFMTAERVAGRWTDRLIVINDDDERQALRARIVPSHRLVRMPGVGLDTNEYAPGSIPGEDVMAVRGDLGIPADSPVLVGIGELNANKRQADAIAALARMDDRQAHLLLLGDGPERDRIAEFARSSGVERRVHLLGNVEDVRPALAAADALISTSRREGLSRSIMEALSLEVPVVASSARGNAELVADSGFITPVGDVTGMATSLDWLLDHPDEARRMGRRGRVRMADRYDIAPILRMHERMYLDLIEDGATARDH